MKYLLTSISRTSDWGAMPDLLAVQIDHSILDKARCRSEAAIATRTLDPEFDGSRYNCMDVNVFPIFLPEDEADDVLEEDEWIIVDEIGIEHTTWGESIGGEAITWSMLFDYAGFFMFSGFGDESGDLYEAPISGLDARRLIEAYYARVSGE